MSTYIRPPAAPSSPEGALPFPKSAAPQGPPHVSSGASRDFYGGGPQGPKIPSGLPVGPYQLSRAKNNLDRSLRNSGGNLDKDQTRALVKTVDKHDYAHDSVNIVPRGPAGTSTAAAGSLGRPALAAGPLGIGAAPAFAGALGPGPSRGPITMGQGAAPGAPRPQEQFYTRAAIPQTVGGPSIVGSGPAYTPRGTEQTSLNRPIDATSREVTGTDPKMRRYTTQVN